MGRLTTHVLDTANGKPAAGVSLHLYCAGMLVAEAVTNADGRCDEPLLDGDSVTSGVYDLVFGIGDYFGLPEPRFLDEVVVRFTVGDTDQHYHVPLIATPWSYTTYRGS